MQKTRNVSSCPYGLDGLSTRTKNVLISALGKSYRSEAREGEVEKISVDEILAVTPLPRMTQNFGRVSRQELHEWLTARGAYENRKSSAVKTVYIVTMRYGNPAVVDLREGFDDKDAAEKSRQEWEAKTGRTHIVFGIPFNSNNEAVSE